MKKTLGILLILLAVAGTAAATDPGVYVALKPVTTVVQPGVTFQLDIYVWQAGPAFNAYDAYIGYDPSALQFVPLSPTSLQQGSLMTGACGNTYHSFTQGALVPGTDTLTINHSLMCNGLSLTGPGQLYKLKFKAVGPAGTVTHVTFLRGLQFYNAGVNVNPAYSTDAAVYIGNVAGVGQEAGEGVPRVSAAPNPARRGTVLQVRAATGGPQSLLVRDVAGRVVRHLESGWFAAGARQVRWDGRTDSGVRAASGRYSIELDCAGRKASAGVVLVR